jgi:hypothetical protein
MDLAEPFARTANPKTEVRRCAKCGESALICFQAWSNSLNRMDMGAATRECRCQSCGTFVTLHDPKAIQNLKILGWVLVWTAVTPLISFSLTRSYRLAWEKNPLVPGALYPVIRYRSGPADRRCGACGQPAQLTKTTKHRLNGIPSGTTYAFACGACKNAFTTESAGGIAQNLVLGLTFAGGGGLGLARSVKSGSPLGGMIGVLIGFSLLHMAGRRILAARRNPKIETPHLMA